MKMHSVVALIMISTGLCLIGDDLVHQPAHTALRVLAMGILVLAGCLLLYLLRRPRRS